MIDISASDTITVGAIVTAFLAGVTIFFPRRAAWVPFLAAFPLSVGLYALVYYADGGVFTGRIWAGLVLEGISSALVSLGLHNSVRTATHSKTTAESEPVQPSMLGTWLQRRKGARAYDPATAPGDLR